MSMDNDVNEPKVRRTIVYSFADVTFFTLMVAFGEAMIMLYLAQESPNNLTLAFLASIPTAIGAVTQIIAPHFIFPNSPKRLLLLAVGVQAVGMLEIALSLFFSSFSFPALATGLTLYWVGGMTAAAPWQQLLAHLIPEKRQNSFFANRNALASFVMLVCNLVIGFFLAKKVARYEVFFLLLAAFAARCMSLWMLWLHPTPTLAPPQPNMPEPKSEMTGNNLLRISLPQIATFMFLHKFAVMLSGPFFNPYMLNTLHLSLISILVLSSVPLITRTLINGNWGTLLDRNRMYEGLAISAIGISFLPSMWTFSSNFTYLAGLQVASGLFWSGFELLTILMIQRMFHARIMQALAIALAAGALGSTLGSLAGGRMLDWGVSLFTMFHASSVLRFVAATYLLYTLRRAGAFRFRYLKLRGSIMTVFSLKPWWNLVWKTVAHESK